MHDPAKLPDPYFAQLLADLKDAEMYLRHAIANRHNPFADNGEQRLSDCQANVDRLHLLIQEYLTKGVKVDVINPKQETSHE